MDELSPEFQELDVINPHEQDQYNVLRENCKRYREALEKITSGELPDVYMPSQPVVMFAQQALDEVNNNE